MQPANTVRSSVTEQWNDNAFEPYTAGVPQKIKQNI